MMKLRAEHVFFTGLTLLLIVGDGKLSVIEVAGAAVVLATLAIWRMRGGVVSLHPLVALSWAAVSVFLLVTLPFSGSVAFSLYGTVRFFLAFLVFGIFSSLTVSPALFGASVIGLTSVAALLSVCLYILPPTRVWLPQMSLLSNNYGHHHLVYLLIPILPFVLHAAIKKMNWKTLLLLVVAVGGVIFTRARGAWLLSACYFAYLFARHAKKGLAYVVLAIGVAVFVWFGFYSSRPDAASARLEYWRQAIAGFQSSPIVGTGIGTFYLSSLKYQSAPQSYSWLAHSFPLQTLSEIGVIGAIGVIGLLWSIGKVILVRHRGDDLPILEMILLIGIYSVFDIALDYLVVWLLFWAGLGLLSARKEKRQPSQLFSMALAVVVLFYSLSVAGEAGQLMAKNNMLVEPFNTTRTLSFLQANADKNLSQKQLDTILWFHKESPMVLFALKDTKGISEEQKILFCNNAVSLDSKNFDYHHTCLLQLVTSNDIHQFETAMKNLSKEFLSQELSLLTQRVIFPSYFSPVLLKSEIQRLSKTYPPALYIAKLYYVIGEKNLRVDTGFAKQMWFIARRIYPDMGLLHHEAASLELYMFHIAAEARKVISECMAIKQAALHCQQIQQDFYNLPPPGYVFEDILEFRQ